MDNLLKVWSICFNKENRDLRGCTSKYKKDILKKCSDFWEVKMFTMFTVLKKTPFSVFRESQEFLGYL